MEKLSARDFRINFGVEYYKDHKIYPNIEVLMEAYYEYKTYNNLTPSKLQILQEKIETHFENLDVEKFKKDWEKVLKESVCIPWEEEKAWCTTCGKEMTLVRPGKHQCDNPKCKTNEY